MAEKKIESTPQKEIIRKKFVGQVVSNKNAKTIVVEIKTVRKHPKYQKRYIQSRRYKVHDEKNKYQVGDQVTFVECRPMSRGKRWRVIN
ncbi:MAG: 30S ribosomal protein S17 [Patescibacteria group bacterium]|jgi:small subunit ribosomal protein S17